MLPVGDYPNPPRAQWVTRGLVALNACGATPVGGLLLAARRHSLRVETIDLRNSGDTAGDKHHVVGYGAWAFLEND